MRLACSLLLIFAACAARGAGPETTYRYPLGTVPYVGGSPPTIDGPIQPQEYQHFAAITGMVSFGSGSAALKTLVPQFQQVVWYIGYDDQYLYLAMHSPNPPGGWPLAKAKGRDPGNAILWDDHVEIQIARDRDRATFPGVGFYKLMANAKDSLDDQWYYNGTPGTESAWSYGGRVKSQVTPEYWDLELCVDVRALDLKSLDSRSLVLQLLRADAPGGLYFAGWIGDTWMAWDQFGEVRFDRASPVFRFLDMGNLLKGDMALRCEVRGQTDQAMPVTVRATVRNDAGQVIFDQTREEEVTRATVKPIHFDAALPLSDTGNVLELLATCPGPEGGRQVLYHVQVPIIKLTDEFHEKHLAPWLARRPQGDFDWNFAYWPSHGVARSSLDVDFFGLQEAVARAAAFRVTVHREGDKKVLATATAPVKDKWGEMVVKGLALPPGDYVAEAEVLGADGKTVVGRREVKFVRRHYQWEGNQLGFSDRVIPPYTPIQAKGQEFSVWGRTYTVGDDGLLSKIVAGGGAGNEPILTAPMRLLAAEKGQPVAITGAACRVTKAEPGRAELSATGRLGSAEYRLDSYLEYDGWYHVRLTLTPPAGGATLDSLALQVPLWGAADTMYMQRDGDGRRGNKFGAIPPGRGLVWSSRDLFPLEGWGSFCPIVFLGTGDKGLWWFADDKRAWTLSEDKAAVEVARSDQGVELTLNFLAAPTTLTEPRTLEFAFLIDPVKQMPDERKWAWGRLRYTHNTYGYRYYGGSVDGFENTDEDLEALSRVLTDPTWQIPDSPGASPGYLGHSSHFRQTHYEAVTGRHEMLVLYGSTWLTGLGLDAFDTYGGEWLGRSNWTPNPQTEFTNWWNLQHTVEWKTPRQLTTVGVNFNRAFEDCFVWYHQRLLAKTPVNGTWWDNSSIGTILDYDPVRGEFYQHYNIFDRRRLTKRLCNIGWELNRPPWWINNMHVDWSFNQVAWHIENDFYVDNPEATMMDQLPVDEFRALCRIKRGIVHRLATRGPEGTTEQMRRQGRSAVGMCLLHDIGSYLWGCDARFAPDMLRLMDEKVGYFEGAQFLPYWRNRHVLKLDTPGVYASIYLGKGRALIVVVNEKRQDQEVAFTLEPGIVPSGKPQRMYDAETGIDFPPLYDSALKVYRWGEARPGFFGMPAGGVRLLVVE